MAMPTDNFKCSKHTSTLMQSAHLVFFATRDQPAGLYLISPSALVLALQQTQSCTASTSPGRGTLVSGRHANLMWHELCHSAQNCGPTFASRKCQLDSMAQSADASAIRTCTGETVTTQPLATHTTSDAALTMKFLRECSRPGTQCGAGGARPTAFRLDARVESLNPMAIAAYLHSPS